MENVTYQEMLKFLNNAGADMTPEVDCTYDDMIIEDYWNADHTEVIAMTRFYNSGQTYHYVRSED